MSDDRLQRLLARHEVLLADGATGTNLFAMGLQSGDAPEPWNVAHPERIEALHAGFLDAGSDIVLTNSFGGTRFRLDLHGLGGRVAELNEAAATIARRMADRQDREVVVAGSMGPTGELFEPLGALDIATGASAFEAQARALAAGGADVLWLETLSSRDEVIAAVTGAAVTGLPIVCTLSFDTNGRTMMGIGPADFVALVDECAPKPVAFGSNCGLGPAEVVAGLLNFSEAASADAVLVAKANCGIPQFVDGAIRYGGTPELMETYAGLARAAGARIIGGCCGTEPVHVAAMRRALDADRRLPRPTHESVAEALGAVTAGALDANRPPPASRRRRRRGTGSPPSTGGA